MQPASRGSGPARGHGRLVGDLRHLHVVNPLEQSTGQGVVSVAGEEPPLVLQPDQPAVAIVNLGPSVRRAGAVLGSQHRRQVDGDLIDRCAGAIPSVGVVGLRRRCARLVQIRGLLGNPVEGRAIGGAGHELPGAQGDGRATGPLPNFLRRQEAADRVVFVESDQAAGGVQRDGKHPAGGGVAAHRRGTGHQGGAPAAVKLIILIPVLRGRGGHLGIDLEDHLSREVGVNDDLIAVRRGFRRGVDPEIVVRRRAGSARGIRVLVIGAPAPHLLAADPLRAVVFEVVVGIARHRVVGGGVRRDAGGDHARVRFRADHILQPAREAARFARLVIAVIVGADRVPGQGGGIIALDGGPLEIPDVAIGFAGAEVFVEDTAHVARALHQRDRTEPAGVGPRAEVGVVEPVVDGSALRERTQPVVGVIGRDRLILGRVGIALETTLQRRRCRVGKVVILGHPSPNINVLEFVARRDIFQHVLHEEARVVVPANVVVIEPFGVGDERHRAKRPLIGIGGVGRVAGRANQIRPLPDNPAVAVNPLLLVGQSVAVTASLTPINTEGTTR